MVFPIRIDPRRMVIITKIKTENIDVKSLFFKDELCRKAKPGQYLMIWIPGVDEIPISISKINEHGLTGITVKRIGEASESLYRSSVGNIIGIRGPFGKSFLQIKGEIMFVAGGTGLCSLRPLIMEYGLDSKLTIVIGSKSKNEILFLEELEMFFDKKKRLFIVTEDGSYGEKGLVTDKVEELLNLKYYNTIYVCGPELMIRKIFELAEIRNIPIQASIERIIKCSLGICGSCMLGKKRICIEGPILSSEELRENLDEFGIFKRDFDGRKIFFKS